MQNALQIRIKALLDEDFTNYRKTSMFIGTAFCNGKCCHELGQPLSMCQNEELRSSKVITLDICDLIKRYLGNDLTSAIVFGGLEPFEQFSEIYQFISILRRWFLCKDDVVIYTGYRPEEVIEETSKLCAFENIIIKFGRYIPNKPKRYDETLGVYLVSDNQFAKRIS